MARRYITLDEQMARRYITLDEQLDAMGIPYTKITITQFVCPRCGSRIRLTRFPTRWVCTVCKWKWDGYGENVGPVVKPPSPYERLEIARTEGDIDQWRD